MENKKYYITTAIYYPSANFHIGHCYPTVIADIKNGWALNGFHFILIDKS